MNFAHRDRINQLPNIYIAYKLGLKPVKENKVTIKFQDDNNNTYVCSKRRKGIYHKHRVISNIDLIDMIQKNTEYKQFYQSLNLKNLKQDIKQIYEYISREK